MDLRTEIAQAIRTQSEADQQQKDGSDFYPTPADAVLALLSDRLLTLDWQGKEAGPGHDIWASPTSDYTYRVRHLNERRFDVILNLGTSSIWFKDTLGIEHPTYQESKRFAQDDFRRRMSRLFPFAHHGVPADEQDDDITPEGVLFMQERATKKLEGRKWKNISGLKLPDGR